MPREARVVTAGEAAALVADGTSVAVGGTGCGHLVAESVLAALEERFLEVGRPKDLTLVHTMGLGDQKTNRGIEHFAHSGFVKTFYGSHYAHNKNLMAMLLAGEMSAYVLPAGVICQLYREIAAGRPGLITKTGIGTFVDPELEGARSHPGMAEYVRRLEIDGVRYLFYPSFPIQVGLIRASVADVEGNLCMLDEPALGDNLQLAQAVKNSGGVVVAQVAQVAARHSLPSRLVQVPAALIDYLVVEPDAPVTYVTKRSDAYSGRYRVPATAIEPLPGGPRKVIARRAAQLLKPDTLVNLGFGVANGVATILAEEGLEAILNLTVEQGTYGGNPAVGLDAGAAVNYDALIDVPTQFDFYDGGGLDQTFLSFAQVDPRGRVNVSRFADKLTGPGGFIDISRRAGQVVFLGMLTAGARLTQAGAGWGIEREGLPKFVSTLDQVTYDPATAENRISPVYITERAVFELRSGRLTLTEIAPGCSLESVIAAMGFRPEVAAEVKEMPARLFDAEAGFVRSSMPEAAPV